MGTQLPVGIDNTYPDRSPGDKLHQQHHDRMHAETHNPIEAIPDGQAVGKVGGLLAGIDAALRSEAAPRMFPTVAAAGTSAIVRAMAEYVCDGVNDEVQIAAALNGMSRGGTVVLSEGVFFVDAEFNIDTYRHLEGQGETATKLSLAPGTRVTISSRHSSIRHLELNAWDRAGGGRTDGLPIQPGQGLLDFTGTTQSGLQSFAEHVLFFGAGRGTDAENLGTYCMAARETQHNPEVANYFHTTRDCYFRSAEILVDWEKGANVQRIMGNVFTDYWVGIRVNSDENIISDAMFHNAPGTATRKTVCVDILGDRGDGTAPQLNYVHFEAETGTNALGLRTATTTGTVIFIGTVNMADGNDIQNPTKVTRVNHNYAAFPRLDITVDPTDPKSVAPLSYLNEHYGRWKPRADRFYQPSGAFSTGAANDGRLYFTPQEVPHGDAKRLGSNVATAAAAGTVLRFGLYEDDGGKPGALIAEFGTATADVTGPRNSPAVVEAIAGPVVWRGVVAQGGNPIVATTVSSNPLVGINGGVTGGPAVCLFQDGVSGALPATAAPSSSVLAAGPLVGLEMAPA